MHRSLVAVLCLAFAHAVAAGERVKPRELVHAYPPTGPAEVAGVAAASKVLRTMQRYAVPAFTDLLATHTAHALQGESEPLLVLRKPRLAGEEAAAYVAAAAADGRTLLLASSATPAELRSPGRVPLRPVALIAAMPYVLIASGTSPRQDLGQLIDGARAARGRVLVASAGERTSGYAAIAALRSGGGLPLEPVAYNGGHAAMNAVVAGQASFALVPLPAVLPFLPAGRIEPLAIAQPRRHRVLPNVRTTAEAALDLTAAGCFFLYARADTPRAVIHGLQGNLARGFAPEPVADLLSELGLETGRAASDACGENVTL